MGGCQNYGPFLGTLNIRCRFGIGIQKGTIILTTTHMKLGGSELEECSEICGRHRKVVVSNSVPYITCEEFLKVPWHNDSMHTCRK